MALEFNIITSVEFLRLGTHGELNWPESLGVLAALAKGFIERGTDRAMVDLRDTQVSLTSEQIEELAAVLGEAGFRDYHRVAILRHPHPHAGAFVDEARDKGFNFMVFFSYEKAAEWLSADDEEDPEFDRETYRAPGTEEEGRGEGPAGDGPTGDVGDGPAGGEQA
jgi:hypothetical protein